MTTIASMNVRGASARRSAQVCAHLRAYNASVLLLTEAPAESQLYSLLADAYPHRVNSLSDKKVRGAVVLAREPLSEINVPLELAARCAAAESNGRVYVALYGPANWKDPAGLADFWSGAASFLGRFRGHPTVVSGDFNLGLSELDNEIGPTSSWRRCADPHYQRLVEGGLADAWRYVNGADRREFSYFPNRRAGGREPHGRRLDHMFVSSPLLAGLHACRYDHTTREPRDGSRLADHSAMLLELQ